MNVFTPFPTSFTHSRVTRTLRRPRLNRQLDGASSRSLTLICAPPGTGKTTLVCDWATTRSDIRFLSLEADERINEPGLLAHVLFGGLRAADVLRTEDRPGIDSLLELADDLALAPTPDQPVVIVIDDAEELTDRDIWHEINHLVGTAPSWLHFVVVTRVDPALGLRRLQLNGRLGQIRVGDLAFDAAEAADLFASFGLDLPIEAVERLTEWSEGWAAALCLAARAISSAATGADDDRPWEHLAPSETLVLDFLVEEVLDRLDPADRGFLLQISAADLLTPALATHLTDNPQAGLKLQRLERAGTFLLELEASGDRYRFHSLMASLLRARLYDDEAGHARELTQRAAHWYADNGYPDEAERHAVRAKDWDLAVQLRTRRTIVQLLRTGSFGHGRELVPTRTGSKSPALQLLGAIDAICRRDHRTTDAILQSDTLDEVSDAETELLRDLLEITRARWGSSGPNTAAAFEHIRSLSSTEIGLEGLNSYLLLREGELHLACGRQAEAISCFDELTSALDASPWAAHEANALMALVAAASGAPERMLAMNGAARSLRTSDAGAWLHLAGAVTHGLRGEIAGVRHQIEALGSSQLPCSSLFDACLGPLRAAALPPSGGARTLDEPASGLATAIAVSLGIVEGVDRDGRPWTLPGTLEFVIARARRAVSDGSLRTLLELLLPWADHSMSGQHPRMAVELHVLVAVGELRSEREDAALRRIEQAITLASPAGIWGPFVASEPEVKRLLGRHSWELGTRNPAALEMLDSVRAIHPARMETLTDRERAVLHYLPTLMSNAEIAAEMVVSVNTVKTHLKSIYRKLGVDRRRDALVRARQVELL